MHADSQYRQLMDPSHHGEVFHSRLNKTHLSPISVEKQQSRSADPGASNEEATKLIKGKLTLSCVLPQITAIPLHRTHPAGTANSQ